MKESTKYSILIIMIILTFSIIFWQVPNVTKSVSANITTTNQIAIESEWNTTFGRIWEIGDSINYHLIQTSDNGYALAGITYGPPIFPIDVTLWFVKANATGYMEWNNTWELGWYYSFLSLIQISDGGFVLAGSTTIDTNGGEDMWLLKLNASGNLEWEVKIGGPEDDNAHSIVHTSDGGFVLAGSTWSYGNGDGDMWLVKTDAYGQHEWNKTYGSGDMM